MADLELELRELGRRVEFPPTPELTTGVRRRFAERPTTAWPRRAAFAAVALAVCVGAAFAVRPARTAILRFLDVGAVRIQFVDRLPEVQRSTPVALGSPMSLDESPFPLLFSKLLGNPDALYRDGVVVTLLYGHPNRVRLLVTEIYESGFTPDLGKKLAETGTHVDFGTIQGAVGPGVWLSGRPHVVILPGGPPRLAAETLIWRRGALTLRLEGEPTVAQAVAIAESFRFRWPRS